MKKVLIICAALFLLGLAGGFYFIELNRVPISSLDSKIIYEVQPGASFKKVASDLKNLGLIRNTLAFQLYAQLNQLDHKVKTGEYELSTNMNSGEILKVLISGRSIERSITFIEGYSTYEMAEVFAKSGLGTRDDFFQKTRDPLLIQKLLKAKHKSLEGYLFPETYKVNKYTQAEDLIEQMVNRFNKVYSDITKDSTLPETWTRHQIVTLASIIEKETGAPEERPLISSVFHNRLQKNMRLQTDPTIIYGKAEINGNIELSITRADLVAPTAYNTYVIFGLPPGPIANPGKMSLLAAVNPESSDYLFFVSRNDGTHIFSKDYANHKKAVEEYQIQRKKPSK